MRLDINFNEKEIITNNYYDKTSEKYNSVTNKNFKLFEKDSKRKLKFNISKKIITSYQSLASFLYLDF